MPTQTSQVFAALSSFTAGVYVVLAIRAHLRLHYKFVVKRTRCCWFQVFVEVRDALFSKQRAELFFPLLQCGVIIPLVQILCVWRVHQADTPNVVVLATWQLVLTTCLICIVMAYVRKREYETYFVHAATALQLAAAWMFLFDGAMGPLPPSGDIAVSCAFVVCCSIQLLHPPKRLKAHVDYLDYVYGRGRSMHVIEADEYRPEGGTATQRKRDEENLRRQILSGRVSHAYPHGTRSSATRRSARHVVNVVTRRLRALNPPAQKRVDVGQIEPKFTIFDEDDKDAVVSDAPFDPNNQVLSRYARNLVASARTVVETPQPPPQQQATVVEQTSSRSSSPMPDYMGRISDVVRPTASPFVEETNYAEIDGANGEANGSA